jgi:hypothetical protein
VESKGLGFRSLRLQVSGVCVVALSSSPLLRGRLGGGQGLTAYNQVRFVFNSTCIAITPL